MTNAALLEAMAEAERFLVRAKAALEARKTTTWESSPLPEVAAVKRASMDLTKALARMRKP